MNDKIKLKKLSKEEIEKLRALFKKVNEVLNERKLL